MKNSKKILITLFVLFFIVFSKLYSQNIQQGEFMVVNNTGTSGGHNITVKIYPSGAVFHGGYEYTLKAKYPIDEPSNNIYIIGMEVVLSNDQGSGNYYTISNFDKTPEKDYCSFSLGYGKYRVEILINETVVNWCYVDFSDANYCVNIPNNDYYHKLVIDCDPYDVLYFKYLDNNGNPTTRISADNQIVKVWEQQGTGHGSQTPSKGDFTDYANDISPYPYHDFPITALSIPGNVGHETPEEVYLNLKVANGDANLITDKTINFTNCIFKVDDNKTFTINGVQNNPYPQMLITGQEGKFISGNLSHINFPKDCQLKIENNAKIEANGTIFFCGDPLDSWGGISLSQAGSSFIDGCTFDRLAWAIHSFGNGSNLLSITNNTFINNVMGSISVAKTNNVLISNNHFLLSGNPGWFDNGIQIDNGAYSEDENNSASVSGSINIIGNDFHNGGLQLATYGMAENLISVLIKDNWFFDGVRNMELWFTVGSISDNHISSPSAMQNSIFLFAGAPDFKNNDINSIANNIQLGPSSYPNFAPLQIDNQFIWTGGFNRLESIANDNIYAPDMGSPGYFFTDYGRNYFILENYYKYHLEGYLRTEETIYNSRGNCWYLDGGGYTPIYILHNMYNQPMTLLSVGPPSDCVAWDDQFVDRIITDRGNGIFDTVLITQSNNNPTPTNDVTLYGTGVKNQKLKNYSSAISNIKNLINTYPNSRYLERSIYNLYECYVLSDTNHNQGWRNIIFGDMKNYLEDKIQQYQNNAEFVSVAFDFLLKCKIKIKSYTPAMDGYEFIATNSPSATERLMASINYIDVEGLLPGQGGGVKENNNSLNNIEKINNSENIKPIKDILLNAYSKTVKSIKQKEESELKNSDNIGKTEYNFDKKHKSDKILQDRAINNIRISGSLDKKQRRERIRNELSFLSRGESFDISIEKPKSNPVDYSLSQNYPNPFNPITNIRYSIKDQKLVTLKIYDILGREVKTLVNEVKTPGEYLVEFNGSELASGVYFYRLDAGDFSSVKRMVLIK